MTASHRTPKEPDRIKPGDYERLVRECFLWIFPGVVAVLGHCYGWQKANLPGSGPGLHIAWNDRTRIAVGLAHFVAERLWVFGLYGALLLIACFVLRSCRFRFPYRLVAWIILSLPGFWYFKEMAYLGGKLLLVD
jgi:hypothetical protein